jgi:photosystem II stability/assembly factor-like uncharacterized protein
MMSEKNKSLWFFLVAALVSPHDLCCTKTSNRIRQDLPDALILDSQELDAEDRWEDVGAKDLAVENDSGSEADQADLADDLPTTEEIEEFVTTKFTAYDLQNLGNGRGLALTKELGIIAVGDKGLVAHMREAEFILGPTPPDDRDILAVASMYGTTVTVGKKGLVLRLNDLAWEVLEPPTETDLYGVAVADSDDFYVCGAKGQIFHFHENSWTKEDTGITYNLYAIVTTGTGAIAAGDFGTVIEHRAGIWQRQQVASPASSLRGLFRTPDGITFAVGTGGAVAMQKEGTWQMQITGDTYDPPRDLYAVFGFSSSDVYAVGDKGAVLKFNGKKWSLAPVAGPNNLFADLRAVWGQEAEDGTKKVIAMGLDSRGLISEGSTFKDLNLAVSSNLYGVTFDTDGRVVAVGDKGVALAFDGKRFFGVETSTENTLRSASWPFAVGDKGTLVEFQAGLDIRAKSVQVAPSDDLTDVDSSADSAIAVSRQGTVFRIEREGITSDDQLLGNAILAVCIASSSRIVLGTDRGLLFVIDGGNAKNIYASGGFRAIRDLYCDDSFFLAVGDYGLLLKCDYSSCASLFEEPASFFFGVAYEEGFGLVVGWAGRIVSLDSMFTPKSLDSPTLQTFRAVSIRGDVAALVGDSGLFVTNDWQRK